MVVMIPALISLMRKIAGYIVNKAIATAQMIAVITVAASGDSMIVVTILITNQIPIYAILVSAIVGSIFPINMYSQLIYIPN